nr:ribonuclease H-like domain-containing protein [Tanacetum cinerariifolium]
MIPEPGDTNHKVPANETFHVQTDDELTEKELKQIEADDQAIQTILLGLPEDIYAAVDSYETAQKIWLRVQQMMKGSDIAIQEKKAKLFNEWERFTSNDGQNGVDMLLSFIRQRTCTQDPLALMENSNNPYAFPAPHKDQPSFNQNYMQQPMPNPEDITDLTTAMNMALALMAKAFKLNYSTPTNNNQRISSNPSNRQIAQPGMNIGQDRQMQMVGGNDENQFRQYAGQNIGNLNGYNAVQNVRNQNVNGNLIAARAEGNATGHNADLDEIEEVNAQPGMNIGQDRQMQMVGGNDENQFRQYAGQNVGNLNGYNAVQNVKNQVTSMKQSGETVEQHPANVEETCALYDSLYQNLAIEVEKVNTVNRKLKETNAELTTELARFKNQEKCFKISQEKYDKLERCS